MYDRPHLAFDRESLRSYDADGRLRVARANLSRAAVNPYYGREIPGWRKLGLDSERIYQMWRHPDELAKAAATFAQLPLLGWHVPVNAEDHRPAAVIGCVGSEIKFDGVHLYAPLIVWAQDAIDDIESGDKRELSSAYRYDPDMTPGRTPAGEAYDGVMRNIIGNHVATVEMGRAGPSCYVGDHKLVARMDYSKMFPDYHRLRG
ncbi:conserved hypothetical protein [Methylocella silvestris BL2]|uniref:DUF2213 domain-containing protein n=1 Tax=Methylocella silvestris (strain DSM 15510 / CIP 108128 / LMG 27833 / NCIMB 13906 / BL2) TaxID=395965 RepID=B8EKX0_METSB|nr:DUF2213 domain-containing protein [Methylocella silvestris]ACK51998.1 conserved hypothetical protein [Methylocella silvestris BL2]